MLSRIISQVSQVPLFAEKSYVEKMAAVLKIVPFEPEDPIVIQGTQILDMFWILKGTCRVTKSVPFIKKKDKSLAIFDERSVLQEGEELVHELLVIQEIGPGDCFPILPYTPTHEDYYAFSLVFNKDKYLQQVGWLGAKDPLSTHTYSVVPTGNVLVATTSRREFLIMTPPQTILKYMQDQTLFSGSVRDLQETVLTKQNWDLYKKQTVAKLLKK